MRSKKRLISRRRFLTTAAAGAGTAAVASLVPATTACSSANSANETIRVGVVGTGLRGLDHLWALGYPTGDPADLKRKVIEHLPIANVEVVAVCDAFDDVLDRAVAMVERRGKKPGRYVDWRKMLEKEKLDVVVISTPDHLHAPIAMDAIDAGCDVYVEKCITNKFEEIKPLGEALKKKGRILQAGYQFRHDRMHQLAREILGGDTLGQVHLVQFFMHRNGPTAGWASMYALNGGPARDKVHWEEFQRFAPSREYDPHRYFDWRRYFDYSTGISGDLWTHELDVLQFTMGLGVPHTSVASGGIRHWKDGRDTPDVFCVTNEYPDRDLTVSYNCTLSNAFVKRGEAAVFCGTDATMELSWEIKVYPERLSTKYAADLDAGKMQYNQPFTHVKDTAAGLQIEAAPTQTWLAGRGVTLTTRNGAVVDTTRIHHENFFDCVRSRKEPEASFERTLPSTIGAHMATTSYLTGKRVTWDPVKQQMVLPS